MASLGCHFSIKVTLRQETAQQYVCCAVVGQGNGWPIVSRISLQLTELSSSIEYDIAGIRQPLAYFFLLFRRKSAMNGESL